MESTALEEKINKIRLRNEEIKRRYEEVEADKKNAAKLDALVGPVPVEDWPERKEPPEFSAPAPKQTNKPKHSIRKHSDQGGQYYTGGNEGKKAHSFADGQGPPPDPKYNFLADSEREEYGEQIPKDTERNRGRNNKPTRGGFRRRGSGRDWHSKEQWGQHPNPGDMTLPEYEAWRAERNRIDEARISRQRTAEGNWRREWDNDKVHLADEVTKRENRVTLGDVVARQEQAENEKHYRSPRVTPRNSHYVNTRDSHHGTAVNDMTKNQGNTSDPEKRVVIATDKSIKVMVNHGSTPPKSSVMSVKVSSPNIAGTGRVGPRQRPRVMYSSQSEAEAPNQENSSFARQKSIEEKPRGRQTDQTHKVTSPKSPHPQRHRDGDMKSPFPQRRDNDRAEGTSGGKPGRKDAQKSPYPPRRGTAPSNYPPKSPRVSRRSTESKQKHNSESASSVRNTPKAENIDGNLNNSQDSSAAISHDKTNDSLNDDKNNSVLPKELLPETSVTPPVEAANSETVNHKIEQSSLEESAATPSIESVLETTEDAKQECFEDLYGEASGTQDVKDSFTANIDVSGDSQVINCSANSGLTSNDSGYIELPSNETSIHDVSENDTAETSGIADTSSESANFDSQIAEQHLVIDNLEVQQRVTDEQTVDADKPSSSNEEITSQPEEASSGNSEKYESKDATNEGDAACNIASAKLISQAEDTVTPATIPQEVDNNLVNKIANAEAAHIESEEKDSSSLQGEADTTKDTIDSVSAQSVLLVEKGETSASINDEADTKKDADNSVSAQLESTSEEAAKSPSIRDAADKKKDTDNLESIQSESNAEEAEKSPSVHGKADTTKDADISGSAQLKSNAEEAGTSVSTRDAADTTKDADNSGSVQSESNAVEAEKSPSIHDAADTKKDADNSGSVKSESNAEAARKSPSIPNEADNTVQDAANDTTIAATSQLEHRAVTEEKSLEATESTQESNTTSNDESKKVKDNNQENAPVTETSSSTVATEKD